MKAPLCVLCVALAAVPQAQTFSAAPISTIPPSSSSRSPCDSPVGTRSWGGWPHREVRQRVRGRGRRSAALAAEKLAVDVGDVKRALSSAQDRLEKNRQLFDEPKLQGELEYLEGVSSEAEFWNDGASARKTLGDLNRWVLVGRWSGGPTIEIRLAYCLSGHIDDVGVLLCCMSEDQSLRVCGRHDPLGPHVAVHVAFDANREGWLCGQRLSSTRPAHEQLPRGCDWLLAPSGGLDTWWLLTPGGCCVVILLSRRIGALYSSRTAER